MLDIKSQTVHFIVPRTKTICIHIQACIWTLKCIHEKVFLRWVTNIRLYGSILWPPVVLPRRSQPPLCVIPASACIKHHTLSQCDVIVLCKLWNTNLITNTNCKIIELCIMQVCTLYIKYSSLWIFYRKMSFWAKHASKMLQSKTPALSCQLENIWGRGRKYCLAIFHDKTQTIFFYISIYLMTH